MQHPRDAGCSVEVVSIVFQAGCFPDIWCKGLISLPFPFTHLGCQWWQLVHHPALSHHLLAFLINLPSLPLSAAPTDYSIGNGWCHHRVIERSQECPLHSKVEVGAIHRYGDASCDDLASINSCWCFAARPEQKTRNRNLSPCAARTI